MEYIGGRNVYEWTSYPTWSAVSDIELKCDCGSVAGRLLGPTPRNGTRLVCMCDDCQTYAHFLERAPDVLDPNGGTEVYQSAPARLRFTAGKDQLRCVRQSPKGLMRWYTACCRTPVANGFASARVPFTSVLAPFYRHNDGDTIEEAFGPLRARTQARYGFGELPADAHSRAPLGVIFHAARVFGLAVLARDHSPNPFFDQSKAPIAEPRVLSGEERARLREIAAEWAAR